MGVSGPCKPASGGAKDGPHPPDARGPLHGVTIAVKDVTVMSKCAFLLRLAHSFFSLWGKPVGTAIYLSSSKHPEMAAA